MDAIWSFYTAHALWTWLALGAVILAAEVATGTGELLWPAAATVPVAIFASTPLSPGLPAELAVFAVLTIATSLAARRIVRRAAKVEAPDVNDPMRAIIGAEGRAVGALDRHGGRVFVIGKEWAAVLDGHGKLEDGAPIVVTGVVNAVMLKVRPVA